MSNHLQCRINELKNYYFQLADLCKDVNSHISDIAALLQKIMPYTVVDFIVHDLNGTELASLFGFPDHIRITDPTFVLEHFEISNNFSIEEGKVRVIGTNSVKKLESISFDDFDMEKEKHKLANLLESMSSNNSSEISLEIMKLKRFAVDFNYPDN